MAIGQESWRKKEINKIVCILTAILSVLRLLAHPDWDPVGKGSWQWNSITIMIIKFMSNGVRWMRLNYQRIIIPSKWTEATEWHANMTINWILWLFLVWNVVYFHSKLNFNKNLLRWLTFDLGINSNACPSIFVFKSSKAYFHVKLFVQINFCLLFCRQLFLVSINSLKLYEKKTEIVRNSQEIQIFFFYFFLFKLHFSRFR